MARAAMASARCNFSRLKQKMWVYLLLTALTFYVVAFMVAVPSVGPVPAPVVKSLLFAVVHYAMHMVMRKIKHRS